MSGYPAMTSPDSGALALARPSSRRLWVFAALAALGLHLGGAALVLARISGSDSGGSLGANADAVGVELAAPPEDTADLPVNTNLPETQYSPQLSVHESEIKPSDLTRDTPTETDNPDRVVSTNDSKKPTEDNPNVEAKQTSVSEYEPYSPPTSQKTFEAPRQSETSTAPQLGMGKDKQKLVADWGKKVSAYFALHKRYPKVEKGKSATVRVALVLNRLGHVVSVGIQNSSGDPAYDEAALDMVRRSDPVPKPPVALTDDQVSFSLDVNFKQ